MFCPKGSGYEQFCQMYLLCVELLSDVSIKSLKLRISTTGKTYGNELFTTESRTMFQTTNICHSFF